MADGNPGDIFLRHSAAVLDALVSSPAIAEPGPNSAKPTTRASSTAPDGASAVSAVPTPPSTPSPKSAGSSVSAPDGPSPSERINAILNRMAQPTRAAAPEATTLTMSSAPGPAATPSAPAPPVAAMPRPPTIEATMRRLRARLPRSPVVLLLIAAVAAVLIILLLFASCGRSSNNQSLTVITSSRPAADSAAPPPAATDDPIQVRSASSECPSGSTSAMDAFNGQEGKAWDCVRAYHIDGQILTIDLGKSYQVTAISIVPGWDHVDPDGTDEWTKHRTAEKVSYQFDDPNQTTYTQETLNRREAVTTKIDPPVAATQIVLTILNSSGDPSVNDTAVSSILITGH
jgi:hypothetical protein